LIFPEGYKLTIKNSKDCVILHLKEIQKKRIMFILAFFQREKNLNSNTNIINKFIGRHLQIRYEDNKLYYIKDLWFDFGTL